MMKDEVITELWAVKDAIAREHNYDIDGLFRYFKEAEEPAPSGVATETEDSKSLSGGKPAL